ncbi:MAG: tRNA (adenosine(37)-N6)-dimethylallyltransferase MiaA, partial [Lysobacterales bacterium]
QLVSVDSALVYRGLDIGAAKPDAAILARHPHRLIDIREPAQPYSAAEFRADALAAMCEITASGAVPLLVGGTGLYFRALEHGLSALPEADCAVRAGLATEAAAIGWPALHARLAALDPAAAARIGPDDAQRIQRALEVIVLTGQPLSAQQGGHPERLPWRVLKLALVPADRAPLHARIARRFDAMLGGGFLDEARRLHADPALHADLPAMRAVGYRQAWPYLQGTIDVETFRERAIFATRQLAKRQITWLRRELDARGFDPDSGALTDDVAQAIRLFLPCGSPAGMCAKAFSSAARLVKMGQS